MGMRFVQSNLRLQQEQTYSSSLALEGKMKSLVCLILIFLVDTITSEKYGCPEYDVNFWGNDVDTVHTDDWRACGQVCSLVNNCDYWTYNDHFNNGDEGICYLKSSDAGLRKQEGYFSGAKGCY